MKYSRSDVRGKAYAIPQLRCETQSLTSFAGIVLLQRCFALIALKARLAACFRHLPGGKVFSRVKKQSKEPIQVDLFVPHQFGYEFKVAACSWVKHRLLQYLAALDNAA